MKHSDRNHLRLLLGWVRTEIGQEPAEHVETVRKIAGQFDSISDDAKARLVKHHDRVSAVPKYIRAAVKALEKYAEPGDVVDAEVSSKAKLLGDK